jgi:DNA-binding NtrC family response regulator
MFKLLVVDDDRAVRLLVEHAFKDHRDYQVATAADAQEGLSVAQSWSPDVVLLDIHLPEMHGFEFFRKLQAAASQVPVIFATADSASEVVIQAMRIGAFDYLTKPLQIERLQSMVASAARARRAAQSTVALEIHDLETTDCFVGASEAMLEVFKSIGRVAAQQVPVLIRGESGTGKELVARALFNHGSRTTGPFFSINCAAIPEPLLESELFGHEKGAFTGADRRRIGRFEQCDGGTIFLDEVGDMPPLVQAKVLRLLQDQKFERVGGTNAIQTDVRIIAATNRPIEEMVSEGSFREDLLYRLDGFSINLPPLRNRRDDIVPLLDYFLARAKVDMQRKNLTGISQDAIDRLVDYDWPGNVRQLQSVVRQAALHTTGAIITADCLPDFVKITEKDDPSANVDQDGPASTSTKSVEQSDPVKSTVLRNSTSAEEDFELQGFVDRRLEAGSTNLYDEVIVEVERRLITQVLNSVAGNQSKAAEILGITRGKIRNRINNYNIQLNCKVSVETKATAELESS